jgi:hypothetical protein
VLLFPIDDKQSRLDGQDQVRERPEANSDNRIPCPSAFTLQLFLCYLGVPRLILVYMSRQSPAAPACLSAHAPLNRVITWRWTPKDQCLKLLFVHDSFSQWHWRGTVPTSTGHVWAHMSVSKDEHQLRMAINHLQPPIIYQIAWIGAKLVGKYNRMQSVCLECSCTYRGVYSLNSVFVLGGPDRGAAEGPIQQPVWDPPQCSGRRAEKDLLCGPKE